MDFVVIGKDAADDQALERRMQARPEHQRMIARLKDGGNIRHAAALLDDNGRMIGSCMVVSFGDRAELDDWLAVEPYVTGKVWHSTEIYPCNIANLT